MFFYGGRHRGHACVRAYMFLMRDEKEERKKVVKESRNNKPIYGYMLPNLSPSPILYKVQSVYNNDVVS